MEINAQLQQNINKEIIPKNQTQDLKETNTTSQQNDKNGVTAPVEQTLNANNTNNASNLPQDEAGILVQNQNLSFKEQLDQLNNQNSIYNFSLDMDFGGVYNFKTNETDEKEINFFLDLLEKNKDEKNVQSIGEIPLTIAATNVNETTETQGVQATEKIAQIVETAAKTGKPVRIDFDNQITVVLRVDNQGKINAQFYPGDKAAEEYLRNNIQNLRNTFDKENILYSYLDYKQNRGNNGKERKEKQ